MQLRNILALDVGDARIGLAIADENVRLPRPLTTLKNDADIINQIQALIKQENVSKLVVGLPRNMEGLETAQTQKSRQFAAVLEAATHLPVYLSDETLSSHQAEAELKQRGRPYTKGDIDSLAATIILEDFLNGKTTP